MINPDPIEICRAMLSDAQDIRALAVRCRIDAWSVIDYSEEIERPDSIVVKAVFQTKLIGFAVARVIPGQSSNAEADLYNLAVDTQFRRKGTGGLLFAEVVAMATEMHASDIWLEVRESNKTAISFYKAKGFVTEATRPNFYSNPTENALIMRLQINARVRVSGA